MVLPGLLLYVLVGQTNGRERTRTDANGRGRRRVGQHVSFGCMIIKLDCCERAPVLVHGCEVLRPLALK